MEDTVVSPNVCVFSDESLETLNIQIEIPGVEKKDIELQFYDDGFYLVAKKEGTKYMGSYALVWPVQPNKAIAKYADGLLTVNVPYRKPLEGGTKVKID
ncbi:MAG: Hsp20/alpha crystallin family protein [Methanotrichaceae archaeon]|nr:Hsp20/alpha crystallin family protein [Methanotrichaceae archaeon]